MYEYSFSNLVFMKDNFFPFACEIFFLQNSLVKLSSVRVIDTISTPLALLSLGIMRLITFQSRVLHDIQSV